MRRNGLAAIIGAQQLEYGQQCRGTPGTDAVPKERHVALVAHLQIGQTGTSSIDRNNLTDGTRLSQQNQTEVSRGISRLQRIGQL